MKHVVHFNPTILLLLFLTTPALAGSLDDAKFALHARSRAAKSTDVCGILSPNSQNIPCSQYTTAWPLNSSADVYLVVGNIDPGAGLAGLNCGIDYDGVLGSGADLFDFQFCADGLIFPSSSWPDAGSGAIMTWSTCQQTTIGGEGGHAVAGAFYIYAYGTDRFEITPNNTRTTGSELSVADCTNQVTLFPLDTANGAVDFGGGAGFTPCIAPEPPSVKFDFEPGACPNTLALGNGGFVVGAVVGQLDLPVADINPSSIRLNGVTPQKVMGRDVATPFDGSPCDCHAAGADGLEDLLIRVSRSEVLATLGAVQPGDQVVLTVTGSLMDGTPFSATDCATIANQGGGQGPSASQIDIQLTASTSSGRSRVSYSVPTSGRVRLTVFDIRGRLVADLVNTVQSAGAHLAEWNAADQPSGMYFYRLEAAHQVRTEKVMLLR